MKNGCKDYSDCLTCPFPDCKNENSFSVKTESERERHRSYCREWARRKRMKNLEKEFPHIDFGKGVLRA